MAKLKDKSAKMRHGRFLTLMSVLLIVFGLLSLVLTVLSFISMDMLVADEDLIAIYSEFGVAEESLRSFLIISLLLGLVESALDMAAGVIGIRVARGRGRALTCEIMAIILIGFAVLRVLVLGFAMGFEAVNTWDFVFSAFMPMLYMVAARIEAKSSFWKQVEDSRRLKVGELAGPSASALSEPVEAPVPVALPVTFVLADGKVCEQPEPEQSGVVVICGYGDPLGATGQKYGEIARDEAAINHCSVDFRTNAFTGTIAIPRETLPNWFDMAACLDDRDFITGCFYASAERLVFETDDPRLAPLFMQFMQSQVMSSPDCPAVLCNFLRFMTRNDALLLNDWRDRLNRLEHIASGDTVDVPDDFDMHVSEARDVLYALTRFYKQLLEMSRVLATTRSDVTSKADRKLFQLLADRSLRLASEAGEVASYAMEVRVLYQSRIGARQAEIATVLTIVATVCMSVSVITGWYGMNFENMPELHNRFSYLVIITLCVVVVTLELIFFKKKKWF